MLLKNLKVKKAAKAYDLLKTILMLLLTTGVGLLFYYFGFSEADIIMIYILGVLITSVITSHQLYSLVSSFVCVILFNFLFIEPRFTLIAYGKDYPLTFIVMLLAAFLTGSLAVRLKKQAEISAQSAYRTKILFDTNRLLESVVNQDDIIDVTAKQLIKLLGRAVAVYPADQDGLGSPRLFMSDSLDTDSCISEREKAVAAWVYKNNKHAGATTDTLSSAECLYLSIRMKEQIYGVVGIVTGEKGLDSFEKSILLSILGDCALALENERNRREKEAAAILAEKEQLRANLLRAISHDLRTPLTSISGNASNLISNGDCLDKDTTIKLYTDIYDDSMWLISLVENLLSVTRIEEGQMSLHISAELMDEIIAEALRHINRKSIEHKISVDCGEELLLAKADARLIVQVIINIVDNAIKYTPPGSEIHIVTEKVKDKVFVSIADNGPGIPDDVKPKVFEMFYSGANTAADSRRSLGLGLSLCKSIILAHGGEIKVADSLPHGTIFTFTLPLGEVNLYE